MKKIILIFCLIATLGVSAQTIAEKKAGMVGSAGDLNPELQKYLNELNQKLRQLQEELASNYDQVKRLYVEGASPESYEELLMQINESRENISILKESWRERVSKPGSRDEGYALWHQPETTLEQLVIDYGSSEFVYLIPTEIAQIQLSVTSNIPIPRSTWGEMLEQILAQNGVGVKQLNPFLRELYLLKEDFSTVRLITNDPQDLEIYPEQARVSFLLTPQPEEVQRVWYFLEKFVNPGATVLQRIGRVIMITGNAGSVKDLLKVYNFVSAHKQNLEYKAVALTRVDAEEMAKILNTIFQEFEEEVVEQTTAEQDKRKGSPPPRSRQKERTNALTVISLPKVAQAVFLIGTHDEIEKAEQIIREVEGQVAQKRDLEIYTYKVKHSDPEQLAEMMSKIYFMMIKNRVGYEEERASASGGEDGSPTTQQTQTESQQTVKIEQDPNYPLFGNAGFYQQGGYRVNPGPVEPAGPEKREVNQNRDNFIVDLKSGTIVMVVETDLIPKLQELLMKIDIQKKMIQVEAMLFEKRSRRSNDYGLNLLKIGSAASQSHVSSAVWNDTSKDGPGRGVLDFIFSRMKTASGIPAFDLSYQFLMSQEDIHINASPTVVTTNQVPANISIIEEISVNNGTSFIETSGGATPANTYSRNQYGIYITVTPTVHIVDEPGFFLDPTNYIHLVTDINFDTILPSADDRPGVIRRNIKNEVSVPDGQTVIIGGLRRKDYDDVNDKIPFLGELPGLGKLFSTTRMRDVDQEMFIFITPKIISDMSEDYDRLRAEAMCTRPGDLPCFLARLNEALEAERHRLMRGSLQMLFGRPSPRYICEEVEYDGR